MPMKSSYPRHLVKDFMPPVSDAWTANLVCILLFSLGCRVYIGIMEKKMEATIVYWGVGIMEKKMETTMV